MRQRLFYIWTIVIATGVAACSGGGGTASVNPVVVPTATARPAPAGAATQAVSTAGGAVNVAFSGGNLSVDVPPGALGAQASITATAYSALNQLPVALSGLPPGAVFLAAFAIDTNGAPLYLPLKVTQTSAASVPSGSVVRVARYGKSGFADVDTATVSGSSVSNDENPKYVSISGGGTAAPYIMYAVAPSSAQTPAPISITVAPVPSAPPWVIDSAASFEASGTDANGNPLPFTAAFSSSNAALASVLSSPSPATPDTGTLQATTQGGVIGVVAADPRTHASGTLQATVYTQRPATASDAFTFAGTLQRNDTYNYPIPNPLPPSSVTANVTQTVNVTATSNPLPGGSGSVQDFNTHETDAYPTQSQSSVTDAYYSLTAPGAQSSDFDLLGYTSTDENNDQTTVAYTAPQIVDQLPETAGSAWTNNAAASIAQTFSGLGTGTTTIAPDGSYTESETLYGTGNTYPTVQVALQANPDYSGSYDVTYHETGRPNYPAEDIDYNIKLSSPIMNMAAASQILVTYQAYYSVNTPPPFITIGTFVPWYPVANGSATPTSPLYTEADTNLGMVAVPASCSVPSAFGSQADDLKQTVSKFDPILGTHETDTVDQYVVTGFGPVCVVLSDDTQAYYDYNNDQVPIFNPSPVYQSSKPLHSTSIGETLTLQSSGTNVSSQSSLRRTMRLAPIAPGAIAQARIDLEQITARDRIKRMRMLAARIIHFAQSKGVRL